MSERTERDPDLLRRFNRTDAAILEDRRDLMYDVDRFSSGNQIRETDALIAQLRDGDERPDGGYDV